MDRPDVEQWKGREVARLLSLVETERRYYQEIVAALPVGLAVISRDGSIQSANRAFRQLFQLRSDDLHRRTMEQLLPEPALLDSIKQLAEGKPEKATLFADVMRRKVRVSLIPIRDWEDDSEVEALLVLEEAGVAASAATVLVGAPPPSAPIASEPTVGAPLVSEPIVSAPIVSAAPPAITVPSSLAAPALFWSGDAQSQEFTIVAGEEADAAHPAFSSGQLHDEDRQRVLDFYLTALAQAGPHACEYRALNSRNQMVWYRDSFLVTPAASETPARVAGVITNINERKQAEAMANEAVRLDAVSALSRTLTHDLNNSLMVVTGYGEELLATIEKGDVHYAEVQEMVTAAHRISDLSSQLLPFTRKQAYPAEPMTVADSVAQVTGSDNIETNVPGSLRVMADPEQLEEGLRAILWRLRQYATVSIEAKPIAITEHTALSLTPGDYVDLVFLAPGVEAIAFDSLLSSKDPSGPDCARLHALVREWGGGIWQAPGEVHIVLPVAADEPASTVAAAPAAMPVEPPAPAATPASSAAPEPAAPVEEAAPVAVHATVEQPVAEPIVATPPVPAATTSPIPPAPHVDAETPVVEIPPEPERTPTIPIPETVLVVEDEGGIRALVCKILKRQNYQVLEAASPDEAVEVASRHPGHIDLLVTDVNLPQRTGRQLAEELTRSIRDLKVLYISGYTDDPAVYKGELPHGALFLQKPFTLGSLLKKVRDVLDHAS